MRAILAVLLLFVLAGASQAATVSWEIETALAAKAQAGDAAAATELATRLLTGANGGNADPTSAVYWLQQAGTAHYQPAQVILGDLYFYGIGVNRDYPKALALYRPAADAGEPYALVQMGVLLSRCGCNFHNPQRGLQYFREAAASHFPLAHYNLGLSYEDGVGTPPDNLKAALWYERAAANGDPRSMARLGALYGAGYGGIEKLPKKAFALFQKSAALGDIDGIFHLGLAYAQGAGTPVDRNQARRWLQLAADAGHGSAQEALGNSYLETAEQIQGDYERGIGWLEAAGASGIGRAYNFLAQHFEMKMDYDRAFGYAELASQSRDPSTAELGRVLIKNIRANAERAGNPT